jgi:hypothetical protein
VFALSVLALVVATLALAATAAAVAALLRLASPVAFLLAVYLVAAAEIVLLTEVLSPFHAVGAGGYAVGEAVLLVCAFLVWRRRGRPLPPRLRIRGRAFVAHPVLTLLVAVVAAALVYQAFLGVATPPNDWDSMLYHLPRAAAWYQHGAVGYIANAPTQRMNAFPPNTEIAILYTFAFVGRDTFATSPQLLAELILLVGIYGCSRRLGYARPASLFASLIFATLALVPLEAVSTKNDLVVGSFAVAAFYFLLGRNRREFPLAALALALALGTKLTAVWILPFLLLAAIVVLPRRRFVELAAWSAAAFVAVGSFIYVLNAVETGNPVGARAALGGFRPELTVPGTISTTARTFYDFVDFSGFRPSRRLTSDVAKAGSRIFDIAHIAPNPRGTTANATPFTFSPNGKAYLNASYFGPLGWLLVLPLAFGFLMAWIARRTDRRHGVIPLAIPLYALSIALTARYTQLNGRYMVTPVALTMPLVAWVYAGRLSSRKGLATAAVAAIGAASLFLVHARNYYKPAGLGTRAAVWTRPRPQAVAIGWKGMQQMISEYEGRVPDTRVGAVLHNNDWAYQLYGPKLERRIVYLSASNSLERAESLGLRWVVFSPRAPAQPRRGWTLSSLGETRWVVAERRGG